MKRAPIVVTATAVGFAAVMAFHPKTSGPLPGALPGAGTRASPTGSTAPSTATPSGGSAPQAQAAPSGGAGAPSSSAPPSTTGPSSSQTFTGAAVNYHYGILSVQVTVSGHSLTKVGIASLNDGGNFRSRSIDQQAIPLLEQEAMQAQGASIQGVSGASYTSAGFTESLQSALSKAGL